jgi:hypothetical protein
VGGDRNVWLKRGKSFWRKKHFEKVLRMEKRLNGEKRNLAFE